MNKLKSTFFFVGLLSFLSFELTGCSTTGHHGRDYAPNWNIDVSKIPDAVPKVEPRSKYGNPKSYVAHGHRYYVMKSSEGYDEKGIASWYGMKFYKGKTSDGERYNVEAMTAAHRTLPLPTYVQVTNLRNGRQVVVKINDRGPFADNRIIDLSYVAAKKLGITAHGTGLVEVKAIDPRHPSKVLGSKAKAYQAGEVTTPPISPRVTSEPRLYVQAGAFSNMSDAQHMGSLVKEHTSYPVFIRRLHKKGELLYQVQVGPLPNVDAADNVTTRLKECGVDKAMALVE